MLTVAERERLLKLAQAAKLRLRAPDPSPVVPVDRGERLPLSFAQQRLWFLEQMGSAGAAYHIPVRLRLRGRLDRDALGRALDRIVARHEVLRTTFPAADGEPEQRIAPAEGSGFPLLEHDLGGEADPEGELGRLMAEDAGRTFDLERGPLVRGRLVRLGAEDHVLLVAMHHIVSDGWSMEVLTRELSALYGAFLRGEADPLPPLPVQYADFAAWQRRWVDGEVLRRQADYWKEALAGAPELLELPADRARPARQDPAGAVAPLELGAELTAGLKALGQRGETTLFMTLLAGWAVVLGRLSGQADVVVGTPAAGRALPEVEGLIGFFVNTLAVRVDLGGPATVAELLGQVKERALGGAGKPGHPLRTGGGAGAAGAEPGALAALPGHVHLAERGREQAGAAGAHAGAGGGGVVADHGPVRPLPHPFRTGRADRGRGGVRHVALRARHGGALAGIPARGARSLRGGRPAAGGPAPAPGGSRAAAGGGGVEPHRPPLPARRLPARAVRGPRPRAARRGRAGVGRPRSPTPIWTRAPTGSRTIS
jgi:hypothetical protein